MIIFYSGSGSGKWDKEEKIGICEPEFVLKDKGNTMLSYELIRKEFGDQHRRLEYIKRTKKC